MDPKEELLRDVFDVGLAHTESSKHAAHVTDLAAE